MASAERKRYLQMHGSAMSFAIDEYGEQLFLNGKELPTEDGEVFDLLASNVAEVQLSEVPLGFKVQLCDRVIGSRNELYTRVPHAVFENSSEQGLLAHLSTPFFVSSEDYPKDQLTRYLDESVQSGLQVLNSLEQAGRLINVEKNVYEEIAFLSYSVRMQDQSFQDADAFVTELNENVADAHKAPTLFLCHASEDKPFVDKLAKELDKYALYAWYDKREIFVGDSIVQKVNSGLENSDFMIAVLSPRSIKKPWVVREMSSSLMRQLADKGITVLPVLIEECRIPALLADIKYADFTERFEIGFQELLHSIRKK